MNNYTRMGEVIQKIVRDHGENSLRNPQFLAAVFMDYAPMMKKEKELLRVFLLCNGSEKLLGVKEKPQQDQKSCFDSIVRNMADQYSVAENSAHYACAEFYWAVSNCEWPFALEKILTDRKEGLDVRRDITISQKDRHTGKKVALSVGQQAVNVSIPANVTNGETLCFYQKGMKDSETGAVGDLYITIHITTAPKIKPWVIIVAAVAVIWLVCFFPRGNKNQPGSDEQHIQNHDTEQVVQNQDKGHVHSWQDATCTIPKTCTSCGQTSGSALGHQWREATHQYPKTCTVCGTTEGTSLSQNWRDNTVDTETGIIAASSGGWTTYALTKEGRVYAIGRDHYGQMDVSRIHDAVVISGGDCHVAILHSDGTVSAIGQRDYGQCDVHGWKNMISVNAGVYCTVGICEDGTVRLAGQSPKTVFRVSDWENIVQVDIGDHFIIGLRNDGRVEVTGDTSMAACDVSDWTDIVSVAAGEDHSVGLRSDGTVVATGNRSTGACDVSGWKDIIAISAGSGFTVGLREDGTLVVAGEFTDKNKISAWRGNIHTPDSWTDIIQISCTYNQIVGLTKDGYIYACGFNTYGQCDTEDLHRQIF